MDRVPLKLPPLRCVAAVVKDIESTSAKLQLLFGIGPWAVRELSYGKADLRSGGGCTLRVARASLGSSLLELIQPLEGRSIWSRFLASKGEGWHHLGFTVEDLARHADGLRRHGIEAFESGSRDGARWSCVQLQPGGLVVELQESAGTGKPIPETTSPEDGGKPDFYHVSAAVQNLGATTRLLSALWGLGPWTEVQQTLEGDWLERVSGVPCRISLAYGKLEPIILELIQPVEGRSYWSTFVGAGGEGWNHVAFSVSDWQEKAAELERTGGRMVAGGVQNGMHWGYFEVNPGRLVVEFEEKMHGKQQFRID